MSARERREKEKEAKRSTKIVNFIYFVIIVAVAYFLSSLVMNQVDVYDALGLYKTTLPLIKKPATDIPEWAIQLVLAGLIFFILQFLLVIVVGMFKKEEDEFAEASKDYWKR
jgi:preprotein translocase subunit SecG